MFDAHNLIHEIEKRPAIYDAQSEDYGDWDARQRCWSEIGEVMFQDWNELPLEEKEQRIKELMKKWKGIRDNFVKEQRARSKTSKKVKRKKYLYFDKLLFLLPHLKVNENPVSNALTNPEDTPCHLAEAKVEDEQQEEVSSDQENQQTTPSHDDREHIQDKKRKMIQARVRKNMGGKTPPATIVNDSANIFPETAPLQRDERSDDRFGNKSFLLSFAPIMDNMPQPLFLQARLRIAEIFSEMC
ncbi:uncharacterized protein [Palaemon carinicauda]|uniref:uncharacterized protein n=1 Tax=Palaemon carinicauda TaxID=392227 RepID=UPI0035B5D3C0